MLARVRRVIGRRKSSSQTPAEKPPPMQAAPGAGAGARGTTTEAPPSEETLREALHAAYVEAGKGKLERTFRRADFVTTVCGAVGTIYTGLLALVFSVGKDGEPLPARGVAPAIFLGLALFFSAVNVGFIRATTTEDVNRLRSAVDWEDQEKRLGDFLRWIDAGAMARAWALRYAVVSLGAGVALLPLPFIDLGPGQTVAMIVTVTAAAGVWLVGDWLIARGRGSESGTPERP